MAGETGLQDATWDSASCAKIRFGAIVVPFMKFTPPKVEVKTEKPPRVGEMLAQKRTPGRGEIGDASGEILLTDYVEFILPRFPRHGATFVGFVVTNTVGHPSVRGSYAQLIDGCRMTVLEGPELDGSEKGLVKKVSISVINVFEKGADGIWKALNQLALPSSQAVPLLQF